VEKVVVVWKTSNVQSFGYRCGLRICWSSTFDCLLIARRRSIGGGGRGFSAKTLLKNLRSEKRSATFQQILLKIKCIFGQKKGYVENYPYFGRN